MSCAEGLVKLILFAVNLIFAVSTSSYQNIALKSNILWVERMFKVSCDLTMYWPIHCQNSELLWIFCSFTNGYPWSWLILKRELSKNKHPQAEIIIVWMIFEIFKRISRSSIHIFHLILCGCVGDQILIIRKIRNIFVNYGTIWQRWLLIDLVAIFFHLVKLCESSNQ